MTVVRWSYQIYWASLSVTEMFCNPTNIIKKTEQYNQLSLEFQRSSTAGWKTFKTSNAATEAIILTCLY